MNIFTSSQRQTAQRVSKAFTLIELLVVIAIIAILAAILFPVFARARENARRSSCSSNLKQIGLGIMQYTQDYDEFYVPFLILQSNRRGWAQTVQPYVKSQQLFQCPSEPTSYAGNLDAENAFFTQDGSNDQTDYFYNKRIGNRSGNLGISLAAVVSPSVSIMAGDYTAALLKDSDMPKYNATNNGEACSGIIGIQASGNCGPNALHPEGSVRHLEGANYLFADGHVKFQKPTQLYGASTPFTTSGSAPTFRVD